MQAQTKCGTPLYFSPELCEGKPYDKGADTWALGCTLYHVMALKQPWTDQAKAGKGMAGMMNLMRVICSKPLDLQALRVHYSFELCGLIASMVSKEAAARPDARDVLASPCARSTPEARAMAAAGEVRPQGILDAAAEWFAGLLPAGGAGSVVSVAAAAHEQDMAASFGTEAHAAVAKLQRSFRKQASRGHFQGRGRRGSKRKE